MNDMIVAAMSISRTASISILLLSCTACLWGQTAESQPIVLPVTPNLDSDDPLNDLSGRMEGIATQLGSGASGAAVDRNQTDVIGQLDAMIAALKKKSGS